MKRQRQRQRRVQRVAWHDPRHIHGHTHTCNTLAYTNECCKCVCVYVWCKIVGSSATVTASGQCTGQTQLCNTTSCTSHSCPSLSLTLSFSLSLSFLLLLLLLHWQQTTRNFYARFLLLLQPRGVLILLCHVEWQPRLRLDSDLFRLCHTQKVCRPNRVWWWYPAWLYQTAISHD